MRLIDADELKTHKFVGKKYVLIDKTLENIKAYQQGWNDAIDAIIDNAPTADDWQKYSDELWKNAYRKGKEDVIHSISKQYSEHNELVPIWLSIGDMKGGAE